MIAFILVNENGKELI